MCRVGLAAPPLLCPTLSQVLYYLGMLLGQCRAREMAAADTSSVEPRGTALTPSEPEPTTRTAPPALALAPGQWVADIRRQQGTAGSGRVTASPRLARVNWRALRPSSSKQHSAHVQLRSLCSAFTSNSVMQQRRDLQPATAAGCSSGKTGSR
jgi:hypothetical protein